MEPVGRADAALSRARVLEAALRYADEHGLSGLSMRQLGKELGVAAMSLYKYVTGKDDLLDGIVELLWAELQAPEEGDWRRSLRAFAISLREIAHRHPETSALLLSRGLLPPSALRLSAFHLRNLQAAGFDWQRSVTIVRAVIAYACGYAMTEISVLRSAPPVARAETAEFQVMRRVIEALPSDLPDDLARVAVDLAACDSAAQFDAGIELLLSGAEPDTVIN